MSLAAIPNTETIERATKALGPQAVRPRRSRVVIADDHLLMAQGLAKLMEGDFEVVGVVGNGRELLDIVESSGPLGIPDLALMDVCMPELNGVETARKLRELAPNCKAILISMHAQPEFIREAFRAGAAGYLLKLSAASELMTAITEVLAGRLYVGDGIACNTLASCMTSAPILSTRQREVLGLVAEGCSAKEIAERLHISVKTAQFHKTGIMSKLQVHTTAELTKYALGHGLASY